MCLPTHVTDGDDSTDTIGIIQDKNEDFNNFYSIRFNYTSRRSNTITFSSPQLSTKFKIPSLTMRDNVFTTETDQKVE